MFEVYIKQLDDDEFGLLENGRVIAIFETFKLAKLFQLTATLKETENDKQAALQTDCTIAV